MKLTLADGSRRGLSTSAWLFKKDPTLLRRGSFYRARALVSWAASRQSVLPLFLRIGTSAKESTTNSMLSKKNQAAWPLRELQPVLLSPQQIQSKIAKCGQIVTHPEEPCRHKFFPQNRCRNTCSVRKTFLSPYPASAGLPCRP